VATIEPSLTMTKAWGTGIKVETIPLMFGADYRLMCNTITPDGQYLVCEAMSVDFWTDLDRHGGTRPGKVVLVDVHSHAVTEIRTLSRKDAQAFDTAADDKWITWIEAADVTGFKDAAFFTYDRATYTLTSEALKDVQHPAVTDPTSHGVVVWTDSFVLQGGVLRKKVLATGQTEVLAQNALQPKISWPYVAWLQVRESTPDITTYFMTVLNLDVGQRKTLRDPYGFYFDIDGNTIVWATRPGEVVLTDIDETYRQVLVRGSYGDLIEGLNINDRLVSWMAISSSNGQVWDRELGRLVTLDGANVNAQFLSGKYLLWEWSKAQDPNDPPGKVDLDLYINVLDTSTLPK